MSGPETAAAGMQAISDVGGQVMSKISDVGKDSDAKAEGARSDTSHHAPRHGQRMSPSRVDGAVQSIQNDFQQSINNDQATRPTTEDDLRDGLIGRIHRFPDRLMYFVSLGVDQAWAELSAPPRPSTSNNIGELLCFAAAMAIGGGAASIAATVTAKLIGEIAKRPIELGLREAIKHGLRSKATPAPVDGRVALLPAFRAQLHAQQMRAVNALDAEFSLLHMTLASLSTAELSKLAEALTSRMEAISSMVHESVANQTVVAWTNFLARIHHGAMGEWDLWADNGSKGAVELKGAAPKPTTVSEARETTAGNVAPRAARQLHNANAEEHVGILEIAVGLNGSLLTDGRGMNYGPSYGMRLENVGPGARARIQRLGQVRDAPINKLIRIWEVTERSVSPVGSVMITADGYVRYFDLGGQTRVHPDPRPQTVKEALGIEPRAFRVNVAANERVCRELAERAQDFPLSWIQS